VIILALDLATVTGWALQEGLRYESGYESFGVKRGESPGMRFVKFRRWLQDMATGHGGDNREERAWAAGFFDGEGHVATQINGNGHGSIHLVVPQAGSPALPERFKAAVGGVGVVQGPYQPEGNRQKRWQYQASSLDDVLGVVHCLWPWLGEVKRKQATEALGDKWLAAKAPWPITKRGLIVYEQAHHRGGAATAVAVGLVSIVQELAAIYGLECAPVHSATLKKWTTGRGNAKKPEMLEAVARRWRRVDDDNEADAVALLHYALAEIVGPARVDAHP
jgi:hypothetical protein